MRINFKTMSDNVFRFFLRVVFVVFRSVTVTVSVQNPGGRSQRHRLGVGARLEPDHELARERPRLRRDVRRSAGVDLAARLLRQLLPHAQPAESRPLGWPKVLDPPFTSST